MQTHTGWVAFELGHVLSPEFDINFVLYPEPNQPAHGINCKASVTDILESELRDYLTHGGICKAVVRGTRCIARAHEPGWGMHSNEYLRISWAMREPEPGEQQDDDDDDEQRPAIKSQDDGTIIIDDDDIGDEQRGGPSGPEDGDDANRNAGPPKAHKETPGSSREPTPLCKRGQQQH